MDQNIATRMKGCDLIVHCPCLSFVWMMCEFVSRLSVCNAKERSSSSFTVWDGKMKHCKKQYELAKFVLVFWYMYRVELERPYPCTRW